MTRRPPDVVFLPKDVPLRRDVHLLGRLLGEILVEQGGRSLFDRVEAARRAARARRRGDPKAAVRLERRLAGLSPAEAEETVRAFSAYFGLVNMAERVHRIRRRRDYLRRGVPQPGSFADVLGRLKDAGTDAETVRRWLGALQVTPVFTAHPTEATRRTLLRKEQRIARALVDRIEPKALVPTEERAALARVRTEVAIAWQTEEHAGKPTVADEVEHVAFFLTNVLYRVLPAVYRTLSEAVAATYGDTLAGAVPRDLVRFGSWVGGDMDGNPEVGPDTIRATLARHRELVLDLYRAEVDELFDHLSHSEGRIATPARLARRIADDRRRLVGIEEGLPERYRRMPYRVFLWHVRERLDRTKRQAPGGYAAPGELEDDLRLVLASLGEHRGAGGHRVERLLRRVECFGFHLATLDVRQDALVHRRAVAQALGDPAFVGRAPAARTAVLARSLAGAGTGAPSPAGADELALSEGVFRAIGEARTRYGAEAIGPYIVSMAEGPDDALAVLYLARRAGLVEEGGRVPLDVAPLFETVDDLARAGETLARLVDEPSYREHLRSRGDRQWVMLGYSDSNKESGLGASRWALYCAQKELVAAARAAPGGPVELRLFHGRGGTISRGGGKPRNGILAEPPEALAGRLRMTEQGEIISMKYGLRDIALRTIELVAGAVLERSAAPAPSPVEPAWLDAAALLAERSRAAYRTMVFGTPGFEDYFRAATPIDVIERLQIGSRPASRRGGGGIETLRAIPWVFAWTQSRHLVPGWYGMGTGLEAAIERFGLPTLRAMVAGWPFFANLVADMEMVLAKADLDIARHYAALAGATAREIFPRLAEEFERARRAVCAIHDVDELLDRDPVLQRSIRLRNPYVDPMSLLQVDLLRRWRATGRQDAELERALLTTVRGIARGMQNTG